MRRLWTGVLALSVVALGATVASAQSPTPVSRRPFSGLFGGALAPRPMLRLEAWPVVPGRKDRQRTCDIIVMPADPRLDPRISIAPPASQPSAMRQAAPPRLSCR
jgi:hypothetical protein